MSRILKRLNAYHVKKIADVICDIWNKGIDEKESLISFEDYAKYIRKNYHVHCTSSDVDVAWYLAYEIMYGVNV